MTSTAEAVEIKVNVLYFAALREQAGRDSENAIVLPGCTAAQLYGTLSVLHRFTLPQQNLRCAVNHRFVPWDTELEDGATVAFIPPVAGG